MRCPLCDKSSSVNRVLTWSGTRTIHVNYCKDCFIEFKESGCILPPLIEKDLSGVESFKVNGKYNCK